MERMETIEGRETDGGREGDECTKESGIKGVEWKCDRGKTKLTDPQYYQHGRHLF
jgi:hypothetical protein